MKEFRFSEVIPPGSRGRDTAAHGAGGGGGGGAAAQGDGDVNSINNLVSVSRSLAQAPSSFGVFS